jgi:dihydrofolate reductase
MELTADLFSSLDGFAAGENTEAFYGYSGPDLDRWVREAQEQPQLIVMGRVTYQALAEISGAASDPGSARMTERPKVVFSSTLAEPLAWANTRLIRGDLAEGIEALKKESPVPLRTIGSLSLVRSLLRLGLVDVLRVTVFPLTLGPDGREPIYAGYPRGSLELTGTRILDGRIVMLDYRPARG